MSEQQPPGQPAVDPSGFDEATPVLPGGHTPLPRQPDLEADQGPSGTPLPVHLHPGFIALVLLGGSLGTAAREALSLAIGSVRGVPITIWAINVVGALLLGILLESLARRGPDHGRRRRIRLGVGTGFMGGFTTYSSLATGTAQLLGEGRVVIGLTYGLLTVLVGACATALGIWVASRAHERRSVRDQNTQDPYGSQPGTTEGGLR